jgi:hypothetical protein
MTLLVKILKRVNKPNQKIPRIPGQETRKIVVNFRKIVFNWITVTYRHAFKISSLRCQVQSPVLGQQYCWH